MCNVCRNRWSRPPPVPAKPPSRRKKAAAASTSAAPPQKKPRTVAQSLNDANTALKKKHKAMTDKTEAAEEMFTQQVTAKEYAHVLRTREYKKILGEAGQAQSAAGVHLDSVDQIERDTIHSRASPAVRVE